MWLYSVKVFVVLTQYCTVHCHCTVQYNTVLYCILTVQMRRNQRGMVTSGCEWRDYLQLGLRTEQYVTGVVLYCTD